MKDLIDAAKRALYYLPDELRVQIVGTWLPIGDSLGGLAPEMLERAEQALALHAEVVERGEYWEQMATDLQAAVDALRAVVDGGVQ